MMDRPTLPELLTAVRGFLEGPAMAQLHGHTAYHARVAINALRIAERELAGGPTADAAERARLAGLLGAEEADLEAMNRALCMAIRSGDLTLRSPGLIDHLTATTIDKVAIDQPNYSGLTAARAD